jgi:hypothetical protein
MALLLETNVKLSFNAWMWNIIHNRRKQISVKLVKQEHFEVYGPVAE